MQINLVHTLIAALVLPATSGATPVALQRTEKDVIHALANRAACSPAVEALATGISDNIADQNNEVKAVTALGTILAKDPVDETAFTQGQATLLGFVQKGIAIRKNNQAIAPTGNAAIAGLATVAMAQVEELNLTMSLGMGGVDVTRDSATVAKLKMDFNGGIGQNKKNLAAATTGCTSTNSSSTNARL